MWWNKIMSIHLHGELRVIANGMKFNLSVVRKTKDLNNGW